MTSLDGLAAIDRMRGFRTNVPGTCLNTVWQAYGSYASTGPHAGQYPLAMNGWDFATKRHPGDANPPAGFPVYFGQSTTRTDSDKNAGDVAISTGGGGLIATDYPYGGVIGLTSITARARQTQRPYLGWCEDFLGYDISGATFAGGNATPIPSTTSQIGDGDMAVQYFRRASTGQIGRFADRGVKLFGSKKDYDLHRDTIRVWLQQPANKLAAANGVVTLPPDSNKAANFVNLPDDHWNLEIAVRGGTY